MVFRVAFFLAAPKSLNQSLLEKTGGESGIRKGSFGQILWVQRDAANRSPYRQLGSITSGTIVTEKTLINAIQPHYGMDGMDAISWSRHKPPPLSTHLPPGLLGFWAFGLLGFWVWAFGLLGFWAFGLLGFWAFGLLGFWAFGLSQRVATSRGLS